MQFCRSGFLHIPDTLFIALIPREESILVKVQHFGVSRDNGAMRFRGFRTGLGGLQGPR